MGDNSWYEKGEFPPALTMCIYSPEYIDDSNQMVSGKEICFLSWFKCKDGDDCVAIEHRAFGLKCYTSSAKDFRPIKTERELAIEAACKVIDSDKKVADFNINIDCSAAIRFTIEKLFDAGLLRSKNES